MFSFSFHSSLSHSSNRPFSFSPYFLPTPHSSLSLSLSLFSSFFCKLSPFFFSFLHLVFFLFVFLFLFLLTSLFYSLSISPSLLTEFYSLLFHTDFSFTLSIFTLITDFSFTPFLFHLLFLLTSLFYSLSISPSLLTDFSLLLPFYFTFFFTDFLH
ncbi:unnamed protein product [Acanthosepion pharaonis]|uniref:Uncharacterized protein n=1 Tax=Acanthosepion pharaonis TaxID=158019 RepID=A0A812BU19_ACAPH|nr:unnamed protein product [Sepia pharaonis]